MLDVLPLVDGAMKLELCNHHSESGLFAGFWGANLESMRSSQQVNGHRVFVRTIRLRVTFFDFLRRALSKQGRNSGPNLSQ
jgi:hypothetical protein